MKTRLALIAAALLALSGCTTIEKEAQKTSAALNEFEKLGVTEIVVTGKWSHTDYSVTTVNGVRRAVVNHSNAYTPQIRVVRETKETP